MRRMNFFSIGRFLPAVTTLNAASSFQNVIFHSTGTGNDKNKLMACEYFLKSGMTFDEAIKHILEINQLTDPGARFSAISVYNLPIHYAKTFNPAQIALHQSLQSGYLSKKEKFITKQITFEKIAELKIPDFCCDYKLQRILLHLLMTQNKTWEETVRIVNGDDYHNKNSLTLFNLKQPAELDKFYIEEVLYSRIYRDQARALFNLPVEILDDTCTWFNHEVDVKVLKTVANSIEKQGYYFENNEDAIATAKIVLNALKELNSFQKWVVVVGGSFEEAKQMYTEELYTHLRPALFEERGAKRDLDEFRQKRDAGNAAGPRM